ncbi:MAG: hypothetical protein ACREMA_20495, partial [Longimicrobiales bacterium]
MLRLNYRTSLILAWFAIAGCASTPRKVATLEQRDLITAQAIERMNASTAYDVLARHLNRSPLRSVRGGETSFERPQEPIVIIDGNRSEVNQLRTLPAHYIESIEILNATDGTL